MAAIINPDGSLDVPVTVTTRALAGDGSLTLWPGEPGYDEAAAGAIPADQHPLRKPRDFRRAAELAALFQTWDRATG
jgi:hypothetical protein